MKKWWMAIFLMAMGTVLQAQSSIKGSVIAEGNFIANATVSLNNIKQLTDSTGSFNFHSLEARKYHLIVSMVGFESFHKTIVLSTDDVKSLAIELQQNTSSLDAVVVTGTMKPVTKLESPIAVEVYSPQFFKKNPSPSLFEALQNVNGVRPQINCNVCSTGDIHINGLEGPYTMVTIDGMPIVSSLSSVYGLFGIPTQLIERVEIVKGPASGLYGSEAIGGLINIITKSPDKAPKFAVNLMSTSWQEHNADLGFRFKTGRATSLVGVNYFNYGKPFDKNGDNFTDATLQHRISVFNKWSLHRNHKRSASLALRYLYEDRWGGEMQWKKKFRGTDSVYGESIYTNRWEAIGNYQLPLVEKILFSFSATSHDQNSFYGVTPFMADQKILFGQAVWDKQLGNHSTLLGLAGRYNYYDDNSTATIDTLSKINKPEKYFLPGIFLQNEWKLNPRNTLLLGLRYDHHPAHKTILTPRVAYKWAINEKEVFRLNAGTGFRVVNIFTEDHAALTGARAIEIREKLDPEKSYNVNLNYSRKFGGPSRSVHMDASAWYSYFKNQIIADYQTDPNKIIYDNLKGHAVSKGLTLNLELNFMQRLKGLMGITLQDVAKVEENANGKLVKERPLLTEKWSGTWSLSYSFPASGITIDYTGNIYGPMKLPLASHLDPRNSTSPAWSIQNIQMTKWMSKSFELFGGVKNLLNWTPAKNNDFIIARSHDPFDKKIVSDVNGAVLSTSENPYALTFDPAYVYAPNQGIRFFAGLRFNIR